MRVVLRALQPREPSSSSSLNDDDAMMMMMMSQSLSSLILLLLLIEEAVKVNPAYVYSLERNPEWYSVLS